MAPQTDSTDLPSEWPTCSLFGDLDSSMLGLRRRGEVGEIGVAITKGGKGIYTSHIPCCCLSIRAIAMSHPILNTLKQCEVMGIRVTPLKLARIVHGSATEVGTTSKGQLAGYGS
jgi:hypothetical protein